MQRIMLVASVVTLVFSATPAEAKKAHHRQRCQSISCEERVARKQCSQKRVIPCIKRAAIHYRQPFSDMVRVARCESGLRPEISGHHQGMYQYLWSTWATTPYRRRSPYSAKWASLATAWMWKQGRRNEWECQ